MILFFLQSFNCLSNELDTIRKRVVAVLLQTEINKAEVNGILNQMDSKGAFTPINYEDLSRTAGFPHRRHTSNLVYLATAFTKKNFPLLS
ncbi:hypothetical protein [Cyclobacterium plantarum]|uniref:hypothetical protein n=1 Tax=Cyclobacterium plantarum TaxID=2716263 RepID=UPI003F717F5D